MNTGAQNTQERNHATYRNIFGDIIHRFNGRNRFSHGLELPVFLPSCLPNYRKQIKPHLTTAQNAPNALKLTQQIKHNTRQQGLHGKNHSIFGSQFKVVAQEKQSRFFLDFIIFAFNGGDTFCNLHCFLIINTCVFESDKNFLVDIRHILENPKECSNNSQPKQTCEAYTDIGDNIAHTGFVFLLKNNIKFIHKILFSDMVTIPYQPQKNNRLKNNLTSRANCGGALAQPFECFKGKAIYGFLALSAFKCHQVNNCSFNSRPTVCAHSFNQFQISNKASWTRNNTSFLKFFNFLFGNLHSIKQVRSVNNAFESTFYSANIIGHTNSPIVVSDIKTMGDSGAFVNLIHLRRAIKSTIINLKDNNYVTRKTKSSNSFNGSYCRNWKTARGGQSLDCAMGNKRFSRQDYGQRRMLWFVHQSDRIKNPLDITAKIRIICGGIRPSLNKQNGDMRRLLCGFFVPKCLITEYGFNAVSHDGGRLAIFTVLDLQGSNSRHVRSFRRFRLWLIIFNQNGAFMTKLDAINALHARLYQIEAISHLITIAIANSCLEVEANQQAISHASEAIIALSNEAKELTERAA